MTAPRTCAYCGDHLDAGERCDCQDQVQAAETVEAVEVKDEAPVAEKAEAPAVETFEEGSMEFVMGNSLQELPATIDFNFEALKLGLTRSLAHYEGLVVSEGDIKGAKADRARLNELRTALETKRKEVKAECLKPYNDFERKVKELVALVDKPIEAIDTQLKAYEERRREEKLANIQDAYVEIIGNLREMVPFGRVWQAQWYNSTVSLKKIRESLMATRLQVERELNILETVESEFTEAVKLKYLQTLDLTAALNERNRLKEETEKLRTYEQQQRTKTVLENLEGATPAVSQQVTEVAEQEPIPEVVPVPTEPEPEKVYLLRFECRLTKAQAAELSAWLRVHNISYHRI